MGKSLLILKSLMLCMSVIKMSQPIKVWNIYVIFFVQKLFFSNCQLNNNNVRDLACTYYMYSFKCSGTLISCLFVGSSIRTFVTCFSHNMCISCFSENLESDENLENQNSHLSMFSG